MHLHGTNLYIEAENADMAFELRHSLHNTLKSTTCMTLPSATVWAPPQQSHVHIHGHPRAQLVPLSLCNPCHLIFATPSGLPFLHDLAFSHWVCSPSSGATCASIGPSAQLVAVGCSNGQLELYRCAVPS